MALRVTQFEESLTAIEIRRKCRMSFDKEIFLNSTAKSIRELTSQFGRHNGNRI